MKTSVTRKDVPSSKTIMTGRCRKTGKTGGVSTDTVMVDIFNHLISDFQRNLDRTDLDRFRIRTVKDARSHVYPCSHNASIEIVKQDYQLQKFFSRYTAKDDLYAPSEVEEMTMSSFYKDTIVASTLNKLDGPLTTPVLNLARAKARSILGVFSEEEVFKLCRFGRRASIGVPLQCSYLDIKARFPISCTAQLLPVFVRYLESDQLLYEAMYDGTDTTVGEGPIQLIESLNMSLVPKKFDKLRPINPYTTASVFLSLGVGGVMAERLAQTGLDIRHLQAVHRKWVKSMSRNGRHVTADMKAASLMITWQHVFRILPIDWARYLKKFQVNKILVGSGKKKRLIHTETFAGMGCGFTFPLQMLIFYCLLSAINELGGTKDSSVSAYGDDLIYPVGIHKYVCHIFDKVGFIINHDKTFANGYFRESCGEDCFRGISVRPFSYEGSAQALSGSNLCSFLYKILNGLINRWPDANLSGTLHYIRTLICVHSKHGVLTVPRNFPESSGWRSKHPMLDLPWYVPAHRPTWHTVNQLGFWSFRAILDVAEKRFVEYQYPYFWNSLRILEAGEFAWDPYAVLEDCADLRWVTLKKRKNGRVVKETLKPYVSLKQSSRGHIVRCELPIEWEVTEFPKSVSKRPRRQSSLHVRFRNHHRKVRTSSCVLRY